MPFLSNITFIVVISTFVDAHTREYDWVVPREMGREGKTEAARGNRAKMDGQFSVGCCIYASRVCTGKYLRSTAHPRDKSRIAEGVLYVAAQVSKPNITRRWIV